MLNKVGTVSLRPLTLADTDNIVRWRNSESVYKNLCTQKPITPQTHTAYYEKYVQTGKCRQFIISVTEEGDEYDIGTVFLKNVDLDKKQAECGIFIGENRARGKGYGQVACKLILCHAFDELQLEKVYAIVFCDNISSLRILEKIGFRKENCVEDEVQTQTAVIRVKMQILALNKKSFTCKNKE